MSRGTLVSLLKREDGATERDVLQVKGWETGEFGRECEMEALQLSSEKTNKCISACTGKSWEDMKIYGGKHATEVNSFSRQQGGNE